MINFPDYNLENMGGNSRFNFIPNYLIDSIPYINGNKIEGIIPIKSGAAWYIGKALVRSLLFEESFQETSAGGIYKYQFNGVYPGQNSNISELFDDMRNQPLVIDITDNNGNRRLIGNLSNPCSFKYTFKSKETPSGRPEYTFSFSWESPKPAPFYIP